MSPPIRRKYRASVAFATGCKRINKIRRGNRKIRVPIAMWLVEDIGGWGMEMLKMVIEWIQNPWSLAMEQSLCGEESTHKALISYTCVYSVFICRLWGVLK
ncbi:hypothetical protein Tco_0680207 [Tanacetum coccineum]|uniref:Uncharacterized protein n=1 Tax=Tanacetum coccineum TaxID=301880 RepID=A0ABQ4XL29_9ASTR